MKNKLQPTRTSFPRNFQCKKAPRWLNKFFHFGTENRAGQLKKPPCIGRFWYFDAYCKSFGIHKTENHLGNLFELFFGQELDQMGQKCPYLGWAKNVSFGPNFGQKSFHLGDGVKLFLSSCRKPMRHLFVLKTLTSRERKCAIFSKKFWCGILTQKFWYLGP